MNCNVNYTDNNLRRADTTNTQAHELGHSLAGLLGLADGWSEDPYGKMMEKCVTEKLNQQSATK